MAHHGNDESVFEQFKNMKNMDDLFKGEKQTPEVMDENQPLTKDLSKLGATGEFPDGKIQENDEGQIRVAITQKDGRVVIDFGKQITWIGFTKEEAKGLAELLLKHAE